MEVAYTQLDEVLNVKRTVEFALFIESVDLR
jgi:hypothetical protein